MDGLFIFVVILVIILMLTLSYMIVDIKSEASNIRRILNKARNVPIVHHILPENRFSRLLQHDTR